MKPCFSLSRSRGEGGRGKPPIRLPGIPIFMHPARGGGEFLKIFPENGLFAAKIKKCPNFIQTTSDNLPHTFFKKDL
jgi:hypothetical protein